MQDWKNGKIKLQSCYEILFDEEHHQVEHSHNAMEDVKSLRKICNFVAEKLGYPNYDAYVSQNPDEAIVQVGDSTKRIIQKPKKPKPRRPKKFTGLANCVFSQADEDFEDFSHSYF